MPIKKIREPIYGVSITFICKEEKKKVVEYLKKITGKDYEDYWEGGGGFFVRPHGNKFNYYIIITDSGDNKWEKVLSHEALHVTSRVLRDRGLKLSDNSEEAFTYYIAWIVQECSSIYKNYRKKIMKPKSKVVTKEVLDKTMAKDKKDDMKMIKSAMKKKKK